MVKIIFGLGLAFLYGSLGAANADFQSPQSRAAFPESEFNGTDPGEVMRAASGDKDCRPIAPGQMDDEEKDRRRDVCAVEYDYCYDWCGRSTKFGSSQRSKCNQDCKDKLVECMKKIR